MSYVYNFYCLKTLAKPFYRMIKHPQTTNRINFSNSDFELKGDIIRFNKNINCQIELQYKNYKFYESCLYSPLCLNYDLMIFKNNQFDNKLNITKDFNRNGNMELMNTDLWISLSVENQTTLNNIYDILEIGSKDN
jgi:hypothetical protein